MSPDYAEPGDREAPKDLLAWDVARLVMVARHAFQAGYIEEEEGWAYVRDAAKMAQPSFNSWEDYANRYCRGLYRWQGGPDKTFVDAIDFLLRDAKSPWRTLDWHTLLKGEDFRNPVKKYLATVKRRNDPVYRHFFLPVTVVIATIAVVLKPLTQRSMLIACFSIPERDANSIHAVSGQAVVVSQPDGDGTIFADDGDIICYIRRGSRVLARDTRAERRLCCVPLWRQHDDAEQIS